MKSFKHIFFAKDISHAKKRGLELEKQEKIKINSLKKAKVQIPHIENWKTFEYKIKKR